ncbi:SRPBCC family protein [Ktedonobacter robiniae]|uniref:Activator of Hsp90 ATPase homologue 1/2-like C-terminal domain-containing protein n=1 Tax=Ktedonobacter robiniae TaxID=2778365 RepID=A0ABQ3V2E0_9CHLR|nr:SRPBCC domain-containing protein [Ktedonobacter robiniae]GHO58937.1 hypothetical protein KSB_74120 [Ktedonobacter robiniae]
MTEALTIYCDQFLPYTPAQVWKALTMPELIARWLMPNDFQLQVGHHFTFQNVPIPNVKFGGTVYCEVLGFEPEHWLSFSWVDRGEENGLNSIVTWRLEPEGEGAHLYLEHAGFDPNHPLQHLGYQMMSKGWSRLPQRIADILAEEEK